jgi:hypothetical protein
MSGYARVWRASIGFLMARPALKREMPKHFCPRRVACADWLRASACA